MRWRQSVSEPELDPEARVYCAAHPHVETGLRCSQCGTPICPRCLVMTPVGAKCVSCARARRRAALALEPVTAIAVTTVSLASALVLGVVGSLLLHLSPLAGMVLPFITGLIIGEAASRLDRRRGHLAVRIIAGAAVVLGFFVMQLGDFIVLGPAELLGSGMVPLLLVNGLVGLIENPFSLLFIVIGVWMAVYRAG